MPHAGDVVAHTGYVVVHSGDVGAHTRTSSDSNWRFSGCCCRCGDS